jgi:hypothetical protein
VTKVPRRLLLQRHLEELILVDVAVARHGRGCRSSDLVGCVDEKRDFGLERTIRMVF